MAHDHSDAHAHGETADLKLAFFLNVGFALLELVGGLLINSVAILSDALHDLGDSLSLGLAWGLQRISETDSDWRYSYGYRRFSLLAAFINAVVLIAGSLFILTEAVPRLADPESFDAPGMIAFAVLGVTINGWAAYRLRDDSTSNAQVIGWHLLEDVLGWLAVLIVGIVSLFVDAPILDPLLSVLITLYILVNVIRRLRDSARLFLQAVPEGINLDAIVSALGKIDGVQDVHHTHIWSLDGVHNVFTTHLVVPDETPASDVMRIRASGWDLIRDLDPEHVTIEIEYESEGCGMRHDHAEPAQASH